MSWTPSFVSTTFTMLAQYTSIRPRCMPRFTSKRANDCADSMSTNETT